MSNHGMHAGAKAHIFRLAEKLRNNMTKPERVLWEYLRKKPFGYKFRRQHPFHVYILDFYCHKAKLSIEIDGKSHESLNQKDYDQARTRFIKEMGIYELRFKNEDVISDISSVIHEILLELQDDSLEGNEGSWRE